MGRLRSTEARGMPRTMWMPNFNPDYQINFSSAADRSQTRPRHGQICRESRLMSDEAEDSKAILRQVERDSASLFESSLGRAGRHFGAADAPPGDKTELWGRRVGRVLSLIGFIVLAALLVWQWRGR